MHFQHVGVCDGLQSRNLGNPQKIHTKKIKKGNCFFLNYTKNMLFMLTIVGSISQDMIIYKCTKLHNHSSNRKYNIF